MTNSAAASIDSMPVHLGIRLALDVVCDSNPVPAWFAPLTMDYARRETKIRTKMRELLDGKALAAPFAVRVPKRSGAVRRWSVPSVNEQIVLQTAVSSVAEALDARALDERVYSYRVNRDAGRLALVEPQITAWGRFQADTAQRCSEPHCMLQIDLQDAFGHIDRTRLAGFLARLLPRSAAPPLLARMLDALAFDPGVPLINDSVFFLGNAYLAEVDKIVSRHAGSFFRFVDDYRIFGSSLQALERTLEKIGAELAAAGFPLNPGKIRLGTGQDYLDAVLKLRYAETTRDEAGYVSAAILEDVVSPEQLLGFVARTLGAPDAQLNEGWGRFQLAALRRMRMNGEIALASDFLSDPSEDFGKRLTADLPSIERIVKLLRTHTPRHDELWKSLWLLYLCEDIDATSIADKRLRRQLTETLGTIAASKLVPASVRYRARGMSIDSPQSRLEALHELDYEQEGAFYCGAVRA